MATNTTSQEEKEYHLQFRWNMTVKAENLEEAKQTAPNVLFNHLNQVTLEPTDFFEVDETNNNIGE